MVTRRRSGLLAIALICSALCACTKYECVPHHLASRHDLVDLCDGMNQSIVPPDRAREIMECALRRAAADHPTAARPYNVLILTGGGLYGSFGVGVLNGWTESGTRPTFDVVTGISVGAIQASAAFVGSALDEDLRQGIVGVERDGILRRRSIFALFCAPSLYTPARLARRLEQTISPELMAAVAAGHAAGRRLYVGTCNLDTRNLVIWDMGAIASRGTPEALDLYRKIVLASASIPGAMPPVKLPIEIDGVQYTELHADGGTAQGAFFQPFMISELNRRLGIHSPFAPPGSRLYVINNGKLFGAPECVHLKLIPVLGAANKALLENKGRDELYRIFVDCMRSGLDFRVTMVPDDVPLRASNALQVKEEEQALLYSVGHTIGMTVSNGCGWYQIPPDAAPLRQPLPRTGLRFASPPITTLKATEQTSTSSTPVPVQ